MVSEHGPPPSSYIAGQPCVSRIAAQLGTHDVADRENGRDRHLRRIAFGMAHRGARLLSRSRRVCRGARFRDLVAEACAFESGGGQLSDGVKYVWAC